MNVSISHRKAPVCAYRDRLRAIGRDHVVITIPRGSAAYVMGYRFTTCARAELPDYLAGGAKVADDAPAGGAR